MSSIDQQFIEYVIKSLVSKPDAVKVDRRIDEKGVLLELTVDPEDLGRVIGKRGATAQSLRTLLRALGTKNDARYNLKIVDNGEPRERKPREDYRRDEKADESGPKAEDNETDAVTADEIAQEKEQEPETEDSDDDHDSVISKTRKELEELDDLEV